ncbi:DUF5694 domain-containing protein [Pedobacter rhodius]|uniref:DUF5694 domain-containing protein n=1 Tax=Pedobacter rhodius TaxID=3004098 RepID=A0ABT4KSK8_9SPHI|nr:DUF5694 domain-containing protein [Pedobacter sp. SJ11]MCZ4221918.1 DUF5694 domain-containing protein [Pedobacter sp. SJ11]
MKYSFFLILFLSVKVYAQKVDILLIGVSHNYSSYSEQDFSGIYSKIKKFKPTAFFGEFLSKEDERLVMDYWCKADNSKRLKMLMNNRSITAALLPKIIDSLKKLSLLKPKDYQLKTDLAHAYYLNQDVANGHYQFWQVFNNLRQYPDTKLESYVNKLLSPQLDTTGRSMKRLKTSEYALIAFPIMQEMGISELLAMDCQDYDLNWSASWAAFDAKFNVFRKDTATLHKKELKSHLNKINEGFEKYNSIEKTSKNVTEWLNTEEASAISASGDFYLPEMYAMNNFPKEEMLSKIHWWIMRNKRMCDNVVNQARTLRKGKVVVIAGANHRKYMQDIFKTMPGITVRNINEIE